MRNNIIISNTNTLGRAEMLDENILNIQIKVNI